MIKFGVFGGGSWATALIKILTENKLIVNWYVRRVEQAQAIVETGCNPDYLNFVRLDKNYLQASTSIQEVAEKSEVLLLAVPSAQLPILLASFDLKWAREKIIISAIKGTVGELHEIPTSFISRHLETDIALQAVLAGPCHAEEIGYGRKTYLTIGALETKVQSLLTKCFANSYVDVRIAQDIQGIEHAAIYKNVVGILCGMARGLHYGDNFLAVLVANALAELQEILLFTGSRRPISNSSYVGDLLVTAYSAHSRNRAFGELIGRGYSVEKAKSSMHMVAEGYGATLGLYQITQNISDRFPMLQTAYRILFQHRPALTAFKLLEQKLNNMILATDLDGTFLGGSFEDKMELYQHIREAKNFTLVFVTGRGLETVIPLLNDPLIPTPDYIIADVGATIVNGHTLDKIEPIQSEIEHNWTEAFDLRQQLINIDGIEEQEVPQQRRSSFYYGKETDLEQVFAIAKQRDLEVITSVNKYLDLLPKGVNKGSTLRKLMDMLGVEDSEVLVAGDTLNDLAMFKIGCKGVAVGGSEEALLLETKQIRDVYHAQREGAGGIVEAMQSIDAFRKLFSGKTAKKKKQKTTKNQLVIVYHRLPYDKSIKNGKTVRHAPKSPNGIIPSLLGLFEKGRSGIWIGEEVLQENEPEIANQLIDEQKYPKLWSSTISLSKKDIDQFYRVFSKEAFWPTIFSFVDKAKFYHDDWNHYLHINKIFADRIAREADLGAFVWIHEYNLWMVPAYLKPLRPDLKIGFFHHTTFPGADVFNILPWRREIIGSLLLCDFISFHIPRYVENFIDVLRSHVPFRVVRSIKAAKQFLTYSCALGVESMTKIIEVEGRKIRLGAQPVGVNMASIKRALANTEVQQNMTHALASKKEKGIKTILSVERLDYVKGPLEKIKAFGEFLQDYPEYRGKVELINICTPPSQGMKIYDQVRDQLNQAIGEINGKYATMDWLPIQYFYRSLAFDEVVTYYGISDVAWITPLRDGLNLVAKEYMATKGLLKNFDGALVLSEFAGASVELPYAILTNPYDRKSMIDSLLKALMMDFQERQIRIQRSFEAVSYYDVEYWGKDFVQELEKS